MSVEEKGIGIGCSRMTSGTICINSQNEVPLPAWKSVVIMYQETDHIWRCPVMQESHLKSSLQADE